MKRIYAIFIICVLNQLSHSQCLLNPIQVTNYFSGDCNGMSFQSTVGSVSNVYGSCGELSFESPLIGAEIPSSSVEIGQNSEIAVYPNPALHTLHITSAEGLSYDVNIINLDGKNMYRGNNSNSIDIENFPSGIYLLQLFATDKSIIYSQTFIKI